MKVKRTCSKAPRGRTKAPGSPLGPLVTGIKEARQQQGEANARRKAKVEETTALLKAVHEDGQLPDIRNYAHPKMRERYSKDLRVYFDTMRAKLNSSDDE